MKSMTGYGRASRRTDAYEVTAEIHAVNHRYLEVSARLPRKYSYLEEKVKEQVQQSAARGKVEAGVTLQKIGGEALEVTVDHEVVSAYIQALRQESARLEDASCGLGMKRKDADYLPLAAMLRIPEAFQTRQVPEAEDVVWAAVQPALQEALEQFLAMRETEGVRLREDIAFHLDQLETMTDQVEVLVPETVRLYYDKLYRKIGELLADRTVDESRLVTEAAVVAEKIAVDEELVRLRSHIRQFRDLLESSDPVGRKMDFLVQEMNREVNTTGSKSQSLEITKLVVDMKAEIEKIREQIQNVE